MARYVGPVCKLCRREGMKLYLKGERCYSEKCAYTRRPYPPGQHGQGRIKLSEYAVRLREKQKVRRIYGVLERQFRAYYAEANRRKGRTGEEMLALLERRLDSAILRMGFVVRAGDTITVEEKAQKFKFVAAAIAGADKRPVASWLEVDCPAFTAKVKAPPVREELNEPEIRE